MHEWISLSNHPLRNMVKNPSKILGPGPWTVVSAPGRADFLNTHQDYKGLPVVPVGINLRTYIFAKTEKTREISVRSINLEEAGMEALDRFDIDKSEILKKGWFGNYFRGIVNVLARNNLADKLRGMTMIVRSEIPIGSGLSSSAALEVAFLKLLSHTFNLGIPDRDLAELAYTAETLEVGVPCGRLDQYAAVFGDIIKLNCREPFNVERLPFKDLLLVILDSGIRHATTDIHPKKQAEINEGLRLLMQNGVAPEILRVKLGYTYEKPRWEDIREPKIQPYLKLMSTKTANRFLYTLRAQRSTEFALKILRNQRVTRKDVKEYLGKERANLIAEQPLHDWSHWLLGEIMNEQHTLLRDLYDVSLPQIEEIRDAALKHGSLGVKISGAGLGGCLIALIRNIQTGREALKAGLEAGAKQGWISPIGHGVKVESC